MESNNNNNHRRGRKGTLPDVTSNDQGRRRGMERCLSLIRAGLSSYLCRLRTMCAGLPRLGAG
jgi:hypothetical protein